MLLIVRNFLTKAVTCFRILFVLLFLVQLGNMRLQESWAGSSLKTGCNPAPNFRADEDLRSPASDFCGNMRTCCCKSCTGGSSESWASRRSVLLRHEEAASPVPATHWPSLLTPFDFNKFPNEGHRIYPEGSPKSLFLVNLSFLC